MKTRSILPFAVLGILLALLLAVSACDDHESDDDGLGDSNGAPVVNVPSGEFSKQVGGPYSFALEGGEAGAKEREFECFKKLGLSLSEAVKLNADLFDMSITANEELSGGAGTQKYNFVIKVIDENNKNVEIIVAQWQMDVNDVNFELFMANQQVAGVKDDCVGRQCRKDSRWELGFGAANTMVDLFSEDKEADAPKRKVRVGWTAIEKMGCWM